MVVANKVWFNQEKSAFSQDEICWRKPTSYMSHPFPLHLLTSPIIRAWYANMSFTLLGYLAPTAAAYKLKQYNQLMRSGTSRRVGRVANEDVPDPLSARHLRRSASILSLMSSAMSTNSHLHILFRIFAGITKRASLMTNGPVPNWAGLITSYLQARRHSRWTPLPQTWGGSTRVAPMEALPHLMLPLQPQTNKQTNQQKLGNEVDIY